MEGNQEKRYATRTPRHATPRHATLTKLRVQRKHNVGTWPAYAPKRHTAGRDSAPMLTNIDKGCKRKHSHATALETANTPPKNAKNARDDRSCFSTLKDKFHISVLPCNILYLFNKSAFFNCPFLNILLASVNKYMYGYV